MNNNFKSQQVSIFDVFRKNGLSAQGEKDMPNNFFLRFSPLYKFLEMDKTFYLKGIAALEKKALMVNCGIDEFTDAEKLLISLLGEFNDYREQFKNAIETHKTIEKYNKMPEVELFIPDADDIIKNKKLEDDKYGDFCKKNENLLRKCSSPTGDESFWCYEIKRKQDTMWCIAANNTFSGVGCGMVFECKMIISGEGYRLVMI